MKLKILSSIIFCISLILLTISSGYKIYIMIGAISYIVFSMELILNKFKNKAIKSKKD